MISRPDAKGPSGVFSWIWRQTRIALLSLTTRRLRGHLPLQPDRPTVLIVSHEASRTGAPILVHNLASELSKTYNLIVLSLEGGPLLRAFREVAAEVYIPRWQLPKALRWRIVACVPPRLLPRVLRASLAIRAIGAAHSLHFAVVNSASSHRVAPKLGRYRIPTISLMHEFAGYLGDHDGIRRMFDASTSVIFSTSLTLEDARNHIGFAPGTAVDVIPQGKCVVPGGSDGAGSANAERLASDFRPAGAEAAVIVLGAGSVEYRKGTDTFCTLAAMARDRAPEVNWRFIWVGGTLAGGSYGDFRRYTADQIVRSGVSDIVQVLPTTPAIETAYAMADIFVLPSRLDPLPNVAIDAMSAGRPVLCFEKATGINDLLARADLAAICSAPYLDIEALADRIVALARSPDLRAEVGQRLKTFCDEELRFDAYAAQIAALGEAARSSGS